MIRFCVNCHQVYDMSEHKSICCSEYCLKEWVLEDKQDETV